MILLLLLYSASSLVKTPLGFNIACLSDLRSVCPYSLFKVFLVKAEMFCSSFISKPDQNKCHFSFRPLVLIWFFFCLRNPTCKPYSERIISHLRVSHPRDMINTLICQLDPNNSWGRNEGSPREFYPLRTKLKKRSQEYSLIPLSIHAASSFSFSEYCRIHLLQLQGGRSRPQTNWIKLEA